APRSVNAARAAAISSSRFRRASALIEGGNPTVPIIARLHPRPPEGGLPQIHLLSGGGLRIVSGGCLRFIPLYTPKGPACPSHRPHPRPYARRWPGSAAAAPSPPSFSCCPRS